MIMKSKITLFFIVANIFVIRAQNFNTTYTKNYSSNNCGKESFSFDISNSVMTRTDNYYRTTTKSPARMVQTDFDNSGYYYEMWLPTFYLEQYGIDEYRRVNALNYKICYDKKGGNLLYLFESNANTGIQSGKFYFTDLGREIFCNN